MDDKHEQLPKLLGKIDTTEEVTKFLDYLLTFEEKEQLNKRILLTQMMLFSQKPQREIAKTLGVSISTVTRCSNALRNLPDSMKQKFK